MTEKIRIRFEPEGLEVEASRGMKLVDIVTACGADLTFGCRAGTCGTCRVLVLAGKESLSLPTREERDFLSLLGASENERLGCQLRVFGNCTLESVGV